jgi:hypothetical protein
MLLIRKLWIKNLLNKQGVAVTVEAVQKQVMVMIKKRDRIIVSVEAGVEAAVWVEVIVEARVEAGAGVEVIVEAAAGVEVEVIVEAAAEVSVKVLLISKKMKRMKFMKKAKVRVLEIIKNHY